MMNAPIEESDYEVTKEDKNFVYKIIYDKLLANLKRKEWENV